MHSLQARAARGLLLLYGLLTSGCDVTSPFEGMTIKLNFSPAPTIVSVNLVNARTGLLLEKARITVSIEGAAATRAVDGAGAPTTRFTLENGFLNFGLKGAIPTQAAPVEVMLTVQGPGYLTTTRRVMVTGEKSPPFWIQVVEMASPPLGAVASEQRVEASSAGSVSSTTTLSTPQERNTGVHASVTLQQGTVMKDATGRALDGQLTSALVYFNNRDENALRAFPTSYHATVSNLPGGVATFMSAGFVALELRDEAGRQVSTFSQPVQLSIGVPRTTVHPRLGRTVQAGDTIPYWSYEPRTWRWTYEGRATLVASASGNLTATIPVPHLSYWSLAWYADAGSVCRSTTPIRLTGRPASLQGVRAVLYNTRTSQWMRDAYPGAGGDQIVFADIPANMPVRVLLRHPLTDDVIGEGRFDNLCAGGTIALNAAADVRTMSATANVKGICPNGMEIRPTIPVYSRNVTRGQKWYSYAGFMTDGRMTVHNLIIGNTYEFTGTVVLQSGKFTGTQIYKPGVDAQNFVMSVNLSKDVC